MAASRVCDRLGDQASNGTGSRPYTGNDSLDRFSSLSVETRAACVGVAVCIGVVVAVDAVDVVVVFVFFVSFGGPLSRALDEPSSAFF